MQPSTLGGVINGLLGGRKFATSTIDPREGKVPGTPGHAARELATGSPGWRYFLALTSVEDQDAHMTRSAIEWTDETWNPVTGCVKISPGCKHCYAERFAERFRGVKNHPYEDGFDPSLRPERLSQPYGWKTPRRVFVNSMSDMFADFVPDDYLARVFTVMRETPQHTYQVLTKRADRLREWTNTQLWLAGAKHIWLGVSVENRKHGVPRIEDLRCGTAGVRFLSVEPLLEDVGELDLGRIDWVIVGGESGPGARPMDAAWVRNVRDQCVAQGVAFFFKQWGGVMKHRTGRELDGRTWDEFPPEVVAESPSEFAPQITIAASVRSARSS